MQKENSKDFKIKRLGEHHNLYIQSDKKTKIIQKTKVRLDLLTDIDILLMVEKKKGSWGKICHAIYRCVKANTKYMKNCDKNKESLFLKYWDVNDL